MYKFNKTNGFSGIVTFQLFSYVLKANTLSRSSDLTLESIPRGGSGYNTNSTTQGIIIEVTMSIIKRLNTSIDNKQCMQLHRHEDKSLWL